MNCPSCGAPMQLKADMDSFKCEYCQSVYFPEKNNDGVRVLDEASDRDCPLCKAPLMNAAIAKVRILYCTKCNGMLIPMEVFEGLIAELQVDEGSTLIQSAVDTRDLLRRIDCPQCHKRMDTHVYGGPGNVVIDSCDECCLNWLDRGKLMHIVHAPDDSKTANAEWE